MTRCSMPTLGMAKPPTQADKFKDAAREHGADEDEAAWEARLKKIAKAQPKPEKPE